MKRKHPKTVLTVLGTRPEAIKLAPVIHELRRRKHEFRSVVCVTGQHQELLKPMLSFFGIKADYNLDVMQASQSLAGLTGRILEGMDRVLSSIHPDWVVVQGDTTTAMASALAAYYHRIRVGHVEAGLRTNDKFAPFPEEINRRMAGVLADLHFAPTDRAVRNLRKEGVPPDAILKTGNTVVDALLIATGTGQRRGKIPGHLRQRLRGKKLILVTGHRRESFGTGMEQICHALVRIAEGQPDCEIVYPLHLNPNVREPVTRLVGNHPKIHLIEPLDYPSMIALLQSAWLVLTDSGGIQEEAPTFGVPCLVMRDTTERPEGIHAGVAKLVGTNPERIVRAVARLASDSAAYARMAHGVNPYGDGHASERIADALQSS